MNRILEKVGIHLKPRFFKILAAIFIILIGLLILFAHYSESPSFCKSCHIMKPYYDAWKSSKHNFVACVECHYPPGTPKQFLWKKFQSMSQVVKYVTRTYGTRPFAEIDDSSCLRDGCHAKRLLEGKVKLGPNVTFDHRPHLLDLKRGKQLRCTSCHSQIVQGKHIEVTVSTCFICHFKKGSDGNKPKISSCLTCHDVPTKIIKHGKVSFSHTEFAGGKKLACEKCHMDSVIGEGLASKDKCYDCHNQPDRISKFNDTTFIHDNHVAKHKVECIRCHSEIKHQLGRSIDSLEPLCSSCHVKKHGGVKDMYMGIGGKGTPNKPSKMFSSQVDCKGCHIVPSILPEDIKFRGQTYKTTEISCQGCHDSSYSSILEMWKSDISSSLTRIGQKLNQANLIIIQNNKKDKLYTLYKDAEYNYHFVKDSKGAHNYEYAQELLKKAEDNLDKVIGR